MISQQPPADASQAGIRRASIDDVDQLATLHAVTVATAYAHIFPPESEAPSQNLLVLNWSDLAVDPTAEIFKACLDDDIVGSVALVSDVSMPTGLLLKHLHVHPDMWGQGLGAQLHDRALTAARSRGATELNLWVLQGNQRARAMYERRGWTLVEPMRVFENDPVSIVDVLYHINLSSRPSPIS